MAIVLTRIDNRLLHGVVATQWAPSTGCTRLMVIDNDVANDPQKKETMKFGRPSGVNLSIINEETALTNFQNHKYDTQKVFIVTKHPEILLKIAAVEPLKKVNIGGTVKIENGVELSNRAMADEKDIIAYKELEKLGTKVEIQYVPSDKIIPFEAVVK